MHQVDVRILASTNQDLKAKIKRGEFREDLFYRLNVLPIHLPPLRERREDIPLIAGHLLEKHCNRLNRPLKYLSHELLAALLNKPWPGNVRELENVILQGILFASGDEIRPADLLAVDPPPSATETMPELFGLGYREAKEQMLRRFHQTYLEQQLAHTAGNVTQAAKRCGMERQALQQILRKYGVKSEDFRE